jgi:hypothetical protein
MIDRKEDEAFWPSYLDLMTGLFVLVLVLFVFSYAALSRERDKYKVTAESYDRLKEIDTAIADMADAEHLEYQPKYKRYVFKRDVEFSIGDDKIDPRYYAFLNETGVAIMKLVERLKADPSKRNIKYMIVIEGMASKDNYRDNFGLSYRRAHSLFTFWREHNIVFDPNVCEIILAGSGTEGVGRYTGSEEPKNQRFLIQIIPKVAFQN